jgi:hypothetical protein
MSTSTIERKARASDFSRSSGGVWWRRPSWRKLACQRHEDRRRCAPKRRLLIGPSWAFLGLRSGRCLRGRRPQPASRSSRASRARCKRSCPPPWQPRPPRRAALPGRAKRSVGNGLPCPRATGALWRAGSLRRSRRRSPRSVADRFQAARPRAQRSKARSIWCLCAAWMSRISTLAFCQAKTRPAIVARDAARRTLVLDVAADVREAKARVVAELCGRHAPLATMRQAWRACTPRSLEAASMSMSSRNGKCSLTHLPVESSGASAAAGRGHGFSAPPSSSCPRAPRRPSAS